MNDPSPRTLVLDTSVAVKFYLPKSLMEETRRLRTLVEDEAAELIAPSTIQPELWNALWQQHRRADLPLEVVRNIWEEFSEDLVLFFEIDALMPRSVEIAANSGAIVYDALFLALAEETETVMITADDRLLKTLPETPFAGLAHYLGNVTDLL
ncbi:MAG: type II toxin-antitoxin system VapC family toxin [Actinomycetota bacterium]|nr:type II toxin-antitoxin system VapC family toxin [Actinomycetota bacterium]